jgi:hypothetical protein
MEIEALCGMYKHLFKLRSWLNRFFLGDIWRQADALGVPVPTIKVAYSMLAELNRTFIMPQPTETLSAKSHLHSKLCSSSVDQNT